MPTFQLLLAHIASCLHGHSIELSFYIEYTIAAVLPVAILYPDQIQQHGFQQQELGMLNLRSDMCTELTDEQAQQYINDPLTAPDPSDETGLNTHFRPPSEASTSTTPVVSRREPRRLSKNNPFRQEHGAAKEATVSTTEKPHPSPPLSASPRHSRGGSGSHRSEFMGQGTRPRRSSSLKERFPGDPSVRPLDQLAKEKAIADKARHMTKKHAVRPDTIDSLDDASGLGRYHHEGPYDATLYARNISHHSSPVAAVVESNKEALRATPYEKVIDSVRHHHPLDGVAAYPPGATDRNGHTYDYKEGDNMMTEETAGGGPYKRWPGVQYHPDDIKGKGEPSYSIEKALKDHSLEEKEDGVELQDTGRSRSGSGAYRSQAFANDNDESGLGRKSSLGNRIKRRVGSLRKKHDE